MSDFEMKKKARYDSFVEVIEYYSYLVANEGQELSDEQRKQLQDVADRISCFGRDEEYDGIGWANIAYDLLGEDPVSEDEVDEYVEDEESVMESKKTLMEDIFDDILAAHPEWDTDTMEDINARFAKEEEFNDNEGDGYKIEPPYLFYTKDGKSMQADMIYPFHNDFAIADMNGLKTFIDKEGKMICGEWFKSANDFECGVGLVRRRSGLCNFVKPDGEFLLNSDVDRASDFVNGEAMVINGGRRYSINLEGKEL